MKISIHPKISYFMEQIIDITNFIKNYSHYYQKISISLILAKSKKHSGWFCIFMKILL